MNINPEGEKTSVLNAKNINLGRRYQWITNFSRIMGIYEMIVEDIWGWNKMVEPKAMPLGRKENGVNEGKKREEEEETEELVGK